MANSSLLVWPWRVLAAVVVVVGSSFVESWAAEPGATFTLLKAAVAQDAPAAGDYPFIPHAPGRKLEGLTRSCRSCHSAQAAGVEIPGVTDEVSGDWVLANEIVTWGTLDKHYQAYIVLLQDRSRDMARVLGVVDAEGNSQIHRDVRCLACHSSTPLDQLQTDEQGLVAVELAQDSRVNLGVGCEGCHGASGGAPGSDGWLTPHTNPADWRHRDPEEKWQQYGFYDVRSAISRTRLCASCHIGNARAGRVLTHEMYAAGHPPLPDFAVETFIDQQPPHWREFGMKPEETRKAYLDKTGTTFDPQELHRTKKVLIGTLVNLAEYLKLTADLADSHQELPVPKPDWPELAQFNCYACHHELENGTWRQERGYWLVPGRPAPHEWPFALAGLAATQAGQSEQALEQQLQKLAGPLNAQPFGTEALPGAARAVASWADQLAAQLDGRAFADKEGRDILKSLADLAAKRTLDYDSARQVVWAFALIYAELKRGGYITPFTFEESQIGWFTQRDKLDPVESALAEMDDVLLLDLRKGRETKLAIPGQTIERPLLVVELDLILGPVSKYQPAKFKAQFARIASALDQPRAAAE